MFRVFFKFFGLCFCGALVSCVSRAPTECELDKRSGLYPTSFCENVSDSKAAQGSTEKSAALNSNAGLIKASIIPMRSQPIVKRVWMTDQILAGGHWMQGTWIYVEIEPSEWLEEGKSPHKKLGAAK